MPAIGALEAVYPDARFVMTHRDIGVVLPSLCALKQALGQPLLEHLDLHALGRFETELWSEALHRLVAFRDEGNDGRFFDVSFSELQHDPMNATEQLYTAMGDELTDDTRQRMARWWSENAGDRRTGGRPDPAQFGLDRAASRTEFAFYHRRFARFLDV
jgi:hypothetical protein